MSDELELAKEVAQESVKQLFAPLQNIIERLTGPAATELGLTFGDYFRARRLRNAVRLFQDVEQAAKRGRIHIEPGCSTPVLAYSGISDVAGR